MRNLRNIHRSLLKSPPGQELTASAWDVATDSVICAFGPTKENTLLQLNRWSKRGKTLQPVASWDAPCSLPDLGCDEILDLHYFPDSLTACLVLAGGDIVLVREEPQSGEEKIEIVGSVDVGISAAAWSPDEELLAITTKASTLLYMTRDFENVTDVTLTVDDLKASNQVSLGWGKAETQFKGKRARALRDPTVPETIDEGILSDLDSQETTISWRGDGAYVAVNSVEPDVRRVIRVFSREGILDSVSEPVDGLLGALSWRPAGNLLAGVQRLHNCIKVVFFERNGLRHGQFSLRLNDEERMTWGSEISLIWNVDSSVLAVRFKDRVQLWTMSNYHYYLKQEIFAVTDAQFHKTTFVKWHPEKPLHFALYAQDGLQRLAYASIVASGPATLTNDYGFVAVIDGTCLKVTPLRIANVPPPMAMHEIFLERNAIDVAVEVNRNDSSILIAVVHHEGISLFDWPEESIKQKPPSLRWTLPLRWQHARFKPIMMYLQIAFSSENDILLLTNNIEDGTEKSGISLVKSNTMATEHLFTDSGFIESIVTKGPYADSNTYLLPDLNDASDTHELQRWINSFNHNQGGDLSMFPLPTPRIYAVVCGREPQPSASGLINGGGTKEPTRLPIFSLDENGALFANQRCLAKNCTSFIVTPAHLIFTTGQHLLKFVHMTGDIEDLEIPPDTPESDERCRSVERGARIVTAMPSTFALVMQMPRGNLETIHPRALVLAGIRDSINNKKLKKAFFACRNHRVDMNILHDHAPQQFISNVSLFIEQVKKVEHIDLFLSQLREEDVSKTMYRETLIKSSPLESPTDAPEQQAPLAIDKISSKVNRICDAFLDSLDSRTSTHFQNIVTAHVCKAPPDLDAGLNQIARLRDENPELIDRAIEHICFLADVNRLYDNALGLYDLELALLVAQQSQKDPREYLPFLQNLQDMPVLRRQYSIDNSLNRFQKALRHLCNLNAFDEVKAYTMKHSIYSEALDYYRYQEEKLEEILRLYADYLHQNGDFKEAGIAYEYLSDYQHASESFRFAHLWKESISCANLLPLAQSQLQSLAQTLADTLVESKDFFSAGTIHLDYFSDIPTAARLFCKGYFFADALRIIGLHQRPDLLKSIVDTGLVDGMATMTELLADCKSQLNAQIPRIRELRAKKAEDPLAFFDGDVNGGVDVPDNVSLAPTDASTTGGSLFTRYTNRTGTVGTNATRRTSKNRRREERKRARGKKGSVYEEEYLVNSVGRLIERVNSVNEEVERLVTGLMRRAMRERARAVENVMTEVVELCKGCTSEIFRNSVKEATDEQKEVEGEQRRTEGEGVLWDTLEGERPRKTPTVKDFMALSLLGC